jgi:hypothetical protein
VPVRFLLRQVAHLEIPLFNACGLPRSVKPPSQHAAGHRLTFIHKASLDSKPMWPMQESISIDYVRSVFQLLALAFRQAYKLVLNSSSPTAVIKFNEFSKANVGIKPHGCVVPS